MPKNLGGLEPVVFFSRSAECAMTTMRGGVGCVSARVRRRTAFKRLRGASRVDASEGSRTRRFERPSMDHPLAGRPGPTRRENVRDRARLPVPSREGKSRAPRSHVPSRGAVTSKVFSSAHFFCALACSSRSVSRRAVAIVGVRPETRARKWRRQAIEPFLSVALTAADRSVFRSMNRCEPPRENSRSATNVRRSPLRRARVWSPTRGTFRARRGRS